ncbi:Hypothetical_protein [Hexamita inflata]|uniref:Hypothetical_protein n=1 Tax=Hexamita inflata TaxID=28002 RepID=A0AA86NSZ2_9EUKA|nr:Hypothetical protein HINF_LOCUS12413 [Hexamita inflata]
MNILNEFISDIDKQESDSTKQNEIWKQYNEKFFQWILSNRELIQRPRISQKTYSKHIRNLKDKLMTIWQETEEYCNALSYLFNLKINQNPQLACYAIRSLNQFQQLSFWQYVCQMREPRRSVNELKQHYRNVYLRIQYTGYINEADKLIIKDYCNQHQTQLPLVSCNQLLNSHFKDRDILPTRLWFQSTQNYKFMPKQSYLTQQVQQLQIKTRQRFIEQSVYYTKVYQEGLNQIFKEDHNQKTPKELCQIINQWTAKEKMKFWKHLEKCVDPSKTSTHQRQHYQKSYERHLYSECLSQEDIQYIREFYQNNQNLLLCEQRQQLMNGYFLNRDIFDNDVYKQLSLCKKNKLLRSNSNSKDIISIKQQYDPEKQQTFRVKQQIEITDRNTSIYKTALKLLTNTQSEHLSPKLICETINSLSEEQSKQFWLLVQENTFPERNIYDLRKYYKGSYLRALYDQLTQEDKQYIKEFCKNLKEIQNYKDVTNQLIKSYFKGRNIFHLDVYFQIRNAFQQKANKESRQINSQQKLLKTKQKQVQEIEQQTPIDRKTQMYKEILNIIQQEDCSVKSPQEICQMIQQLDKITSRRFWEIAVSQTQTNTKQQQSYFQVYYCSVLFSDKLTSNDKSYIHNYIKDKLNITTTELTQLLLDTYLKDRDVFYYDVYNYVSQRKNTFQVIRTNYQAKELQQTQQSYTEIYKQGLHFVLKEDCTDFTPQQLCNKICQLQQTQRLTFWYYLSQNVIPKTDLKTLRSYFTFYSRRNFSDSLSQDDIKQIAYEYEQYLSTKLNKIEITQQIIISLFQDRNLFFRSIYLQVVQLDKQHGINSNYKIRIFKFGKCQICQKTNVQNYCKQCQVFFCKRCKGQHVKDTLHFEFGAQ